MCGVQCALGCVCDRLARVVGRARRCCFYCRQRRCVFVAARPCPADPTPCTCIACGAYVVLLISSPARMHLLHVCVCVSAPSPRCPARGDASPATPHAPRVVTHVAYACACARVNSSSRPPPSRMHGACAHRRRRTCSSGQGGASRLGARRPRPPQPISSLSRPGGYLPLGRNGSLLSTTGGLRSNRSWAPRASARMRLTGPTGPDGLGTVGCAAGIGKWGL